MKKKRNKPYLKHQGAILRELRHKANLKTEEVAKEFGMSANWLNDKENGISDLYGADLIKLLVIYNADIEETTKRLKHFYDK